MGKVILTFKGVCANATKNQNGSSIQLANQIAQTEKGPAAREVVVINVKDKNAANLFDTIDAKGNGDSYTVTISKD